jgi:C-terminal processing protease CtpA/Prc
LSFYWEFRLTFRLAAALIALLICGVAPAGAAPDFSAEQAQRDLRLLQRAFVDLHPGLYRYTTPAQIDEAFRSANTEVTQGASRAQMFLLASKLAAMVHCGHTWAGPYNQSQPVKDELLGRADKLPFTLRVVQGRFLVTGSATPELRAGAEILTIETRSPAQIIAALMPYLRADGRSPGSDGKRLSQLDSGGNGGAMDRLFPLLFAPQGGSYTLTVRDALGQPTRSLRVAAMRLAEREAAGLKNPDSSWSLRVEGDTAWLTLPTFAFWGGRFDARAYLANSFAMLNEKKLPYLVIDVRRNEGGDDALGHALLAHLLREAYTVPGGRRESAYERAPYALARHLDTWNFDFFDRTGKVNKGPGRNWLMSDSPARRIEPVATPYAGRVILLVGAENSSAGYLLAREMQRSRVATLLGQPTGGNLRGLNGGELAWLTLPSSGVAVDIPLLAHFAPGDEPDAGIVPEVQVTPRFEDAAAGVDAEVAAARTLIAQWRQQGGR